MPRLTDRSSVRTPLNREVTDASTQARSNANASQRRCVTTSDARRLYPLLLQLGHQPRARRVATAYSSRQVGGARHRPRTAASPALRSLLLARAGGAAVPPHTWRTRMHSQYIQPLPRPPQKRNKRKPSPLSSHAHEPSAGWEQRHARGSGRRQERVRELLVQLRRERRQLRAARHRLQPAWGRARGAGARPGGKGAPGEGATRSATSGVAEGGRRLTLGRCS